MKEKINKALDVSKLRHTLVLEQRRLLEKYRIDTQFSFNGGTFIVDRQLLAFVDGAISYYGGSCVVIDQNDRPVFISDLKKFKDAIWEIYHSASTAYYDGSEELRKQRSVKAVVKL